MRNTSKPPFDLEYPLLLLLLGIWIHLLAECHVRHLESGNGADSHVEDEKQEKRHGQTHEDTYKDVSIQSRVDVQAHAAGAAGLTYLS